MFSNNQTREDTYIIQQLQIIDNKLDELKVEMKTLKDQVEHIDHKLNVVNSSCKNMDEHIGFVENIYDIVKSPFQKILTYYTDTKDVKRICDLKK
jgi:archaellum component FlaC